MLLLVAGNPSVTGAVAAVDSGHRLGPRENRNTVCVCLRMVSRAAVECIPLVAWAGHVDTGCVWRKCLSRLRAYACFADGICRVGGSVVDHSWDGGGNQWDCAWSDPHVI